MSSVDIINRPRWLEMTGTGAVGPVGIRWVNAGWVPGRSYWVNDGVFHGGSSYRAIAEHVASAETEPGVGADWQSAWKLIAARAELTQDFIDLRTEVEANASEAKGAAQATAQDLSDVRDVRADFDVAVLQVGEAIDAKAGAIDQAITDATAQFEDDKQFVLEKSEQTRLDAEATSEDRGVVREDRIAVASDAAISAAAVRQLFGVQIYRSDQVENGEYAAERYVPFPVNVSTLFLELLQGSGQADVHMTVNGVIVAGPWTVTATAPVLIEDQEIITPLASKVSFHTSATTGEVHEIWAAGYGKYIV